MRYGPNDPIGEREAALLFNQYLPNPAVILAVSGGPDSTALLWLAARWRDEAKFAPKLIAATVDHGLRKESAGEALAVKKLARKLKVEHRTLRWTGPKPKTGIQEAARNARYRLLADAARKAGARYIATAHTIDDQAETILFRMARGSGVSGLKGMARITTLRTPGAVPSRATWEGWLDADRIAIVRPFLETPKSRLVATLKAAKIPFAEDPSNRDVRFARSRLKDLMSRLAAEGFTARRFDVLRRRIVQVDDAIEEAVLKAEARLCSGEGPIVIAAEGFADMPYEVCQRLLGRAIARVGDEGPVELGKLEDLFEAIIINWMPQSKQAFRRTLAGAMVTLAATEITVERAPPRRAQRARRPSGAKKGRPARKGAFTKAR